MVSNNYTLTKTKILSGLQCHKKLWYDFHQQISKDNHSIHIGNRFGEEVKKKYKDGYGKFKDFTGPFDSSKVKDTEEAINSNNINVIIPEGETEATTTHNTLGAEKISFEKVFNKSIELLN